MANPRQPRNLIFGLSSDAATATLALAIMLVAAVLATGSAQAQTFTTFDAPGAGTGAYEGTAPFGINAAGDIAGTYSVAGNVAHGFVRAADGTITEFDAPGAGTGNKQGTFPISINTAGAIAGYYSDATDVYHGFVRAANGMITEFDPPGVGMGGHAGTIPTSINTAGAIAGMYRDASLVYHGFVRAANGAIATFDAPGTGTGDYEGTRPVTINTAGDVTGGYSDASYVYHGFVRAADGTITEFDAPGAGCAGSYKGFGSGTEPISINTAGAIAGNYTDASCVRHGFVRAANGTITSFDAPGAGTGTGMIQGTGGFSINDAGAIAGTYFDASAVVHGFLRAANGTITSFDAPGAGTGMLQGTIGLSINAAGDITGTFLDASNVAHGFVLTPATETTTRTTLVSSRNPSTYGQAVTFTAAVTSKLGAPPNGETVTFMEGTAVLGTGTLSGGSASLTISRLKAGTNAITAVYGGDSNFAGSTSNTVSQVVSKATTTTTTTLMSSRNPSTYGQPVTFTAVVTSSAGAPPNGETVTFTGITGTGTLSGGSASFTTSALPVGTAIKAVYGGDSNFAGSTSNTVSEVVGKVISSTKLTSSPGPFVYGLPVTFTAKVTSRAGAPPNGETVTFSKGSKLGTGTLSGGTASFTTSKLPEGKNSVTASYGGDADFTGSASTIAISVVPPPNVAVSGRAPVDFDYPYSNPQVWYVLITNHGPGPAYKVQLASATLNNIGGYAYSPSRDLGTLAAGESRNIRVLWDGTLLPPGFENVESDTVTWTGGTSTWILRFLTGAGP